MPGEIPNESSNAPTFGEHGGGFEAVDDLEGILDAGSYVGHRVVEPLVVVADLVDVRAQNQLVVVGGHLGSSAEVP